MYCYFSIGYFLSSTIIMTQITAGIMEKSAHIIFLTASISVIVMTVSPLASLPEVKPATPSSMATNAPEMAVPNFIAIVPEEKISPVDEVPFFSVA